MNTAVVADGDKSTPGSAIDAMLSRALARFSQNPQQQLDVEKRIGNWRRWMNEYGGGSGVTTCGSAERAYRPEKLTEAESEARSAAAAGEPVNVTDAFRVDHALRQIPKHSSDLLRSVYYAQQSPFKLARLLKTDLVGLNTQRLLALLLLQRRLSILDQLASR